ncbi:glycosyltransferase family 9 protein [Hyphobacterium sp. HN65]|uniref:Glycosyltransferase family 9 protein n=1 Tax=Hyphobacterium lacteum TaxID=3116575 RepID=A0ABU7LTS8_9PROT|nr:glycosyltransferase family 9 protein [Hyphobacterium sp. HN65]MEE2527322.1 glycosyltransferase family 9 protein [Hyphobacterium sp. HN65]
MEQTAKDIIYVLLWGDLPSTVRGLASCQRIRETYPRAKLILLTAPDYEALLKHCPYFSQIETDATATGAMAKLTAKRIKAVKPKMIYDLVGDADARRIKGGLRFSRIKWIDAAPRIREGEHPVEAAAAALGRTGMGPDQFRLGEAPSPDVSWVDYLARNSRMLEPEYFGLNGSFVLLAPAGEEVKPNLRWPRERWASLAEALIAEGLIPAIVGGPSARDTGRFVAETVREARDLTGKAKLVQLAGLARRTRFVFGEDTDLLHLLVAAGPPAAGLYPDGEPLELKAPRGASPVVLLHAPVLAQLTASEALQAMRVAGGFEESPRAA